MRLNSCSTLTEQVMGWEEMKVPSNLSRGPQSSVWDFLPISRTAR